jgi:phosphate transport system substrate-binding protein
MKKVLLSTAFAVMTLMTGCEKPDDNHTAVIPGLTLDNFPIMDGSTSTDPLIRTVACELLGYGYEWEQAQGALTYGISTSLPENFVGRKIRNSQTHGAIERLIEGTSFMTGAAGPDIVFSARKMSADEKKMADDTGVAIIETPVALDALIFMVCNGSHGDLRDYVNPVNSLTHRQLEDIYTAKTKNWKEAGGGDLPIVPFVRNKNSGSQELMESLVMTEPIPAGFYEDMYEDFQMIPSMIPVFSNIEGTPGGIGYTVYYFKKNMVRDRFHVKTLAVNGVMPDAATIGNRSYPFTAEVYMMIRSDLDKQSPAYKVYEYMLTRAGQNIIARSGYVPYTAS